MDLAELESALTDLAATSREPYESALAEAEKSQLPLLGLLGFKLWRHPMVSALRQLPALREGYMVHGIRGSKQTLGTEVVAAAMVIRVQRHGSVQAAVEWLRKILTTQVAHGISVMALWGVSGVEEEVNLGHSVRIMPFAAVPDSPSKRFFQAAGEPDILRMARTSSAHWGDPPAALVHAENVTPFITTRAESDSLTAPISFEVPEHLDNVRRMLTVVGPSVPIQAGSWFQFVDPDIQDAVGGAGMSGAHIEVQPTSFKPLGEFNATTARDVLSAYFGLEARLRKRVKNAVERLNIAMRRSAPGDQSLDACMALESILADAPGENTFKVSLRAARLAATDFQARYRIRGIIGATYALRSRVVHTGEGDHIVDVRVPHADEATGSRKEKRPAADVTREAMVITAEVIRRYLDIGHEPDWYALELAP
jgi:hypothetical protein